jgi:hypothetical protein
MPLSINGLQPNCKMNAICELHGLRVSIKGHDGKWPVSTVKLAES